MPRLIEKSLSFGKLRFAPKRRSSSNSFDPIPNLITIGNLSLSLINFMPPERLVNTKLKSKFLIGVEYIVPISIAKVRAFFIANFLSINLMFNPPVSSFLSGRLYPMLNAKSLASKLDVGEPAASYPWISSIVR